MRSPSRMRPWIRLGALLALGLAHLACGSAGPSRPDGPGGDLGISPDAPDLGADVAADGAPPDLATADAPPPDMQTADAPPADMTSDGPAPDLPPPDPCTPEGATYFTPTVQNALDELGCTAGKCHGDPDNDPHIIASAMGGDLMANYRTLLELVRPEPDERCETDTDLIEGPQGKEHPGGVYPEESLAPFAAWLRSGARFSADDPDTACLCAP